jgi:cobalt-zinc-cadmium efflux system membrane fusion protein
MFSVVRISYVSAVAITLLAGCGTSSEQPAVGEASAATAGGEHSGWWCAEHGVPEELCALCDAKIAADFKAKGDWCREHDRPDSQCFVCHPDIEARFAARYEAKYGKKPPRPQNGS